VRRWYLSFASRSAFLGACVVEAADAVAARERARSLGIDPGGQVMGLDVTDIPGPCFPLDVLMSREDMERIEGERGKKLGEMSPVERARVEAHAEMICDEH
jgi:hypothetical protein